MRGPKLKNNSDGGIPKSFQSLSKAIVLQPKSQMTNNKNDTTHQLYNSLSLFTSFRKINFGRIFYNFFSLEQNKMAQSKWVSENEINEAWRMHPGSEWREKNDSEVEMGVRGLREPGEACFAGVARESLRKGRWTRSS